MSNIDDNSRSYYCSMKFKFLKIDLESKTTYNCHAAEPHTVNFDWLKHNRGQLFNTPTNVDERLQMLANQRNASCEQNCWKAEDIGAVSPRLFQNGINQTHSESVTRPEIIDLTIGPDCNLTCSYCCKEYSTAWRRDIVNNGNYNIEFDDGRFQASNMDRLLLKISQPELKNTQHYQELLDEIKLAAPTLKKLIITGGEPFLDNRLLEIVEQVSLAPTAELKIYTGLGVTLTRFTNIISKLSKISNLTLIVSAENTKKFLEFNRYGIQYLEFVEKINLLKAAGIKLNFHSTITNLTIFGFNEFYQEFSDTQINLTFAYQPYMMSPHILDVASKEQITKDIVNLPESMQTQILKSISQTPTETERNNIKSFVREFAKRRALDVTIFPMSFLKWMELDYVVQ
jgi:organic radical activating enzyme